MLRNRGVGAHNQFAPVGCPGITGPALLSVDDESVAIQYAGGGKCRQIAAGVGLRKSLAPDLLSRQHFSEITLFVLRRAEGDNRRPDQSESDDVGHGRSLGARPFFDENDLLHPRGAASTEIFRPRNSRPTFVVELALPGA